MNNIYNRFRGVSHVKEDDDSKWYVVGDIHGQYDLLMEQLAEISFDFDRDKLFSLGDLVDRGPNSWECLQLTYEPYFHSILGNHEQIMYDAIAKGQGHMWIQNGGNWFYDQDRDKSIKDRQEIADIITNLPNYRTLVMPNNKTIGLIHASGTKQWPPKQTSLDPWGDPTIWCRKFLHGTVPKCHGVDLVVVGHNPTSEPKLENNTWHIDTGYKTGKLTILDLEELSEC